MKRLFSRAEVYAAIDSERDYQDARWGRQQYPTVSGSSNELRKDGNRTLDEFILYMAGYMNDTVQIGSHTTDPVVKLDFIRKVTALGVAAMEQHGAPHRI